MATAELAAMHRLIIPEIHKTIRCCSRCFGVFCFSSSIFFLGLSDILWAWVCGVGLSVPCCGGLSLFTDTESRHCQNAEETHTENHMCHRWVLSPWCTVWPWEHNVDLNQDSLGRCTHWRWATVLLWAGDGGNDVSMIQAANAGVGIEGKVCILATKSAKS